MGPKVNAKAQAGRARKEETANKKTAAEEAAREAALAKEWNQGANLKRESRLGEAALKADEAARKKKEKEALLAQEEAALGSGGKVKSSASQLKSKKKPPTNDLSLLNQHALVSEAEKKRRLAKKAELEKKQQQMEEAEAARRSKESATATMDPLLLNTQQMLEGAIGREGNVQMDTTTMTQQIDGLDGALLSLNIGLPGGEIKRRKALYMAFESKMMPIVRDEHPGLRLSQYKEKIFALWKKSPDNPDNVN